MLFQKKFQDRLAGAPLCQQTAFDPYHVGIVIGVATVAVSVSIGKGATVQHHVSQIHKCPNLLTVSPGKGRQRGGGAGQSRQGKLFVAIQIINCFSVLVNQHHGY